jgi:hypothetical protein
MDCKVEIEEIDAKILFGITYYQYVPRDPPKNSKKNPELLKKVNESKFSNPDFKNAFKNVARHI